MHECLMKKVKKDGDNPITQPFNVFMLNSTCPKVANGYYAWGCALSKCKMCKNIQPPKFKCLATNETATKYKVRAGETFI